MSLFKKIMFLITGFVFFAIMYSLFSIGLIILAIFLTTIFILGTIAFFTQNKDKTNKRKRRKVSDIYKIEA